MEYTFVWVNITDPNGVILERFKVVLEKADTDSVASQRQNRASLYIRSLIENKYEVEDC